MRRDLVLLSAGLLVLATASSVATAQYFSELVGFNGPPINDPATCQEMFRIPEFSPTTVGFIVPNDPGQYNNNAAYRSSALKTEGAAGLYVRWIWDNLSDPDSWLRFTTSNGPLRPNPTVHLQGKVRFKIINRSQLVYGRVSVCLGIRETDVLVPMMSNGGIVGPIEWVGVNTTPNGITAGPNWIVETLAAGDDIQVYPVGTDIQQLGLPSGTAVIEPGPNGVIDTTPGGDDQLRWGYYIGANGDRVPIPVVTLAPSPNPYTLEFNLATGQVRVGTGPWQGGTTGFTGDGILSTPTNRGVFEHIAFVNKETGGNGVVELGIDELRFEAPEPDPVMPPTVVSPIIHGDQTITVTGLQYGVDVVQLLEHHQVILTRNVTSTEDVVFNLLTELGRTAQYGEVYSAIQIVDGVASPESTPVAVLPGPPPYVFSLVIDEDGDGSCSYQPPGGWEFVPVTAVDTVGGNPVPRGAIGIFADNAVWQTVDVPLTDDQLVLPWLGGNGILDDSVTGYYTIDSLWFTMGPEIQVGPHELLIDAVELLDEFDQVIEVIHDFENGINYLLNPRGQSSTTPTSSALSTLASYDGLTCHRLVWTYANNPDQTLGMYHNIGYQCGTSPRFSDAGAKIRFHIVARSQPINQLPLPAVVGPIVGNQNSVRVNNDAAATAVQLYVNGAPRGPALVPSGTYTDFVNIQPQLQTGDSVSATQVIGGQASDFAYPRAVSAVPVPPRLVAPIPPGATTVQVQNVYWVQFAQASLVTVNVNNGQQIATAVPTGSTVTVTLSGPLQNGDVLFATQTVNGATSEPSATVTVGFPAPVIYAAPPAGNTVIRVQELYPTAEYVTVRINDTRDVTVPVPPGARYVDVPVTGLAVGDTLVAFQSAGGFNSSPSAPETVTVASLVSTIVCDNMEYPDEASFAAFWVDSPGASGRLTLSTAQNATPGGAKSAYAAAAFQRVQHPIANLTPTATNPVIWNVNIFDTYGQGPAGANQYAQLNGQTADFWYQHIGMSSAQPYLNPNYYHYRAVGNGGPDWINLNQYDSPLRSYGWHTFTVVHKGRAVDVYVDRKLAAKNISLNADTTMDMCRIGPSASSSIPGYYDDYCVEVGPVRFISRPPNAGIVQAPIVGGDQIVTVADVDLDVTTLQILDGASNVIGQYTDPIPPTGRVDVALSRPLEPLERIRSRAYGPTGSAVSDTLEVGRGNGDILICIGVRETNDTGPLGSPGGTTGAIEWVGASSQIDGAPQGVAISPLPQWRTLTFDPVAGPVLGFTGNGVIDVPRGTLEHLAVTVNAASSDRSSGPYTLYVDNVVNVGAGPGGQDFVLANFDGNPIGSEVLFQEPTYSGTTAGHMTRTPSSSAVSADQGNPGNSVRLIWFWRDTTAQRWARVTTTGVATLPRPIIDLTHPIRMDVLLLPPGPAIVRGDLNCDGVINAFDIDAFVLALTNPSAYEAAYPDCNIYNGDITCDGNINAFDIDAFVQCLTVGCPPCP